MELKLVLASIDGITSWGRQIAGGGGLLLGGGLQACGLQLAGTRPDATHAVVMAASLSADGPSKYPAVIIMRRWVVVVVA